MGKGWLILLSSLRGGLHASLQRLLISIGYSKIDENMTKRGRYNRALAPTVV